MITADDVFVLETGSSMAFKDSPVRIYSPFAVDKDDLTIVDVQVWSDAVDVFYTSLPLRFEKSDLNAFTGSGSGQFEELKNVVEQAVKDYLEGIADNAGTTFAIV